MGIAPIATGSRYLNELFPQDSALFPAPAHIRKAINCFKETMPKEFHGAYSYLSEYCHPNMMAFRQHYQWTTADTIEFADMVAFGAFGAIASSGMQGLLAADELLGIASERPVRRAVQKLLRAFVELGKAEG